MKQKQSFILFETILSMALFFIIFASASSLIFKLQEKSKLTNYQSIALLKLESTKQFLTNNKNLNTLLYSDSSLYYNGNLLLDNVSKYTFDITNKIATINICIDKNKVCTKWKIKT